MNGGKLYTNPELFTREKQSSLFGLLISYEENKVLWIQSWEPYSQQFIFFVTYEWAQQATVW